MSLLNTDLTCHQSTGFPAIVKISVKTVVKTSVQAVLCSLAIAAGWGVMGLSQPVSAAEQVTLRFGPLRQSIAIADLEHFAETGEVLPSLQMYTPLLNEEVRQLLNTYWHVDPATGDRLVEDLLSTSAGERLLDTVQMALPNSDRAKVKATLIAAAQEEGGLSLLGVLRAFPDETLSVDAIASIALASQLNLPHWQSQALRSILDRELTVPQETVFRGAFDPTQSGYQSVHQQTLTLRDRQRDRTIPVDLYWSDWGQGPLVVLSHGFGADRRFLGYIAKHLASHGVTVAAIEHPASNVVWLNNLLGGRPSYGDPENILPATEFVDRPTDVSFLLDELERLNRYSPALQGKFNTEQTVVIGHSLGGYTALALAGAPLNLKHLRQFCDDPTRVGFSPADWIQCSATELEEEQINLRDERVVQVMALNPVMGRVFDAESLRQIQIPTFILAGTDDSLTPALSQQLLPFSELQGSKYLLTAIGGTHLSVGDPDNLNQAITHTLFSREVQGEQAAPLRQLLSALSLVYVKQLTPEAPLYEPFLSSAYVQSFSSPYLQLRLNQELPDSLTKWVRMAVVPVEQLVATTLPKGRTGEYAHLTCQDDFYCLLDKLPLVMFMVHGNIVISAIRLRRDRAKNKFPRLPGL
jgi:predicted dienelactone hydrolase